jgi:hypothetical protein
MWVSVDRVVSFAGSRSGRAFRTRLGQIAERFVQAVVVVPADVGHDRELELATPQMTHGNDRRARGIMTHGNDRRARGIYPVVVVVPLPVDGVVVVEGAVVVGVVAVGVVRVVVGAPLEILSCTLVPLRDWPPLGLCATTVPTG